jgi:hypothetical protein
LHKRDGTSLSDSSAELITAAVSTPVSTPLSTPLMLDVALRLSLSSQNPVEIDNRIELFEQYFELILESRRPEYEHRLHLLSEWAWKQYRDTLSTSFSAEDWQIAFSSIPEFTAVRQHIVVPGEQGGMERLRHQSFHDFLVGRYLAGTEDHWKGEILDAATWNGDNLAPVIFAAELIHTRLMGFWNPLEQLAE